MHDVSTPHAARTPRTIALSARHQRVVAALRAWDRPVVLGASGGVDSRALMLLCARAQIPCLVAHIHHHLRSDAHLDQAMVLEQAQALGLPSFVVHLPKHRDGNTSDRVRAQRYDALTELAARSGGVVLTAHHAEDLLETFLLRVRRGTALEHVFGLQPVMTWGDTPVARPALALWKDELRALVDDAELPWIEDSSNAETHYARNALRPALAPLVAQLDGDARFADTLAALAGEAAALQRRAPIDLDAWLQPRGPSARRLVDSPELRAALVSPEGLQRALYRWCRARELPTRREGLAFVSARFLARSPAQRDERRVRFDIDLDGLEIRWDDAREDTPTRIVTPVPLVRDAWTRVGDFEILHTRAPAPHPPGDEGAHIAADATLWARPLAPGDQIASRHSGRVGSLRKRLTRDGIPAAERDAAIVVLAQRSHMENSLDLHPRPAESAPHEDAPRERAQAGNEAAAARHRSSESAPTEILGVLFRDAQTLLLPATHEFQHELRCRARANSKDHAP